MYDTDGATDVQDRLRDKGKFSYGVGHNQFFTGLHLKLDKNQ